MRVIIAGSRNWDKTVYELDDIVKASGFEITQVVSGNAKGPDQCGERWAIKIGRVPVMFFPANWSTLGKSAGYERNKEMAVYADALIAIWDGQSRGTKHMIETMRFHNKPVYVVRF